MDAFIKEDTLNGDRQVVAKHTRNPDNREFFETASQLPNALWDACFQLPAEGRWWYETLDQSGIKDQFTFFYGLIEHLGRPVGIAPGFVMDVPVEQVAPQEFLRLITRLMDAVQKERRVREIAEVLTRFRIFAERSKWKKARISRELGVSVSTVDRWLAGQDKILLASMLAIRRFLEEWD